MSVEDDDREALASQLPGLIGDATLLLVSLREGERREARALGALIHAATAYLVAISVRGLCAPVELPGSGGLQGTYYHLGHAYLRAIEQKLSSEDTDRCRIAVERLGSFQGTADDLRTLARACADADFELARALVERDPTIVTEVCYTPRDRKAGS